MRRLLIALSLALLAHTNSPAAAAAGPDPDREICENVCTVSLFWCQEINGGRLGGGRCATLYRDCMQTCNPTLPDDETEM